MKDAVARLCVTPMSHSAQMGAAPKNREARENTIPTYSSEAQNRATLSPCVCAIRATETLVRRHVALVSDYRSKNKFAHTS